jgi:hypothetical protein
VVGDPESYVGHVRRVLRPGSRAGTRCSVPVSGGRGCTDGAYTPGFRLLAEDGHVHQGTIGFVIGAAPAPAPGLVGRPTGFVVGGVVLLVAAALAVRLRSRSRR